MVQDLYPELVFQFIIKTMVIGLKVVQTYTVIVKKIQSFVQINYLKNQMFRKFAAVDRNTDVIIANYITAILNLLDS